MYKTMMKISLSLESTKMLSTVVTFVSLLLVYAPAYFRVSAESEVPADKYDVTEYPSRLLASIHEPNEQERLIHQFSTSVLEVTKELISFSPRSSTQSSVEERLARLRQMHPRAAAELLRSRGIVVPPQRPPHSCEHALHYRTMDGVCNNILRPCWGKVDEPYQRWLPPAYANGLDKPRLRSDGLPLPSPRQVYQWVSSQQQQTINTTIPYLSGYVTSWGQILAHDILLTPSFKVRGPDGMERDPDCCRNDTTHPECFPIHLNYVDGFYKTGHCMNVPRSSAYVYNPQSCTPLSLGSPREQMNQLTSFIDASLVYGISEEDMRNLRVQDGKGALLKIDEWGCPERKVRKCKTSHAVCDERCFLTGEGRANENPVLAAIHTVWVREHNRIVKELSQRGWSEETLFHVARKIVGAIMQHITYSEYLPAVLGPSLVEYMHLRSPTAGGYRYDQNVNPTVFNVFATAAFRFGHSMVDSRLMRQGTGYSASPLLSEDFFNVDDFCDVRNGDPIVSLIGGQADQRPQPVDCLFSKQITQHTFAATVNGEGFDLFSVNIQRGRDHGLPSYTRWREACHLTPKINDYSDLRGDIPNHILERIKAIYGPGSVHEVDLYVGGISELPVNGGILGRTFTCIVANQFSVLKFGDRFWYENTNHPGALTQGQISQIQRTTLAGLLCRNTGIREIQRNAFQAESSHNPKVPCHQILRETSMDFRFW